MRRHVQAAAGTGAAGRRRRVSRAGPEPPGPAPCVCDEAGRNNRGFARESGAAAPCSTSGVCVCSFRTSTCTLSIVTFEMQVNFCITKSDVFVMRGSGFVMRGNSSVMQGHSFVMQGDSFVMRGSSSVMQGDSFVMRGDSSVMQGDSFVMRGSSSVMQGDSSVMREHGSGLAPKEAQLEHGLQLVEAARATAHACSVVFNAVHASAFFITTVAS